MKSRVIGHEEQISRSKVNSNSKFGQDERGSSPSLTLIGNGSEVRKSCIETSGVIVSSCTPVMIDGECGENGFIDHEPLVKLLDLTILVAPTFWEKSLELLIQLAKEGKRLSKKFRILIRIGKGAAP